MTTTKNSNLNQIPTVVNKFISSQKKEDFYQTEDQLEKAFIKQLEKQDYTYLTIDNNNDLIKNLKTQIEKLNNYKFSDNEWEKFLKNYLLKPNYKIKDKTEIIQTSPTFNFNIGKNKDKNIRLIDKENIENNSLQVINQYTTEKGKRENRYDVTILVNGLPLIHIELKKRGIDIKEAFNQIKRYQRESFWADSGLFEYVQLFVISNGRYTKYFSNTTRDQHTKELKNQNTNNKKSSHSFEFTNIWADAQNNSIDDLMDFTESFFSKNTILNILTKYCVFTSDKQLLVMRPYQIVATEKIIDKVNTSTKKGQCGTIDAGGYIWHTTGSGKTLTSFKTAQIATKIPTVQKVLFVVDRKDLDYQTMKEYDKFEKGAANSNTSTALLKKQLDNPDSNIIITTIQKLDKFIKKNSGHKIFNDHMVLIFDECHRSQFGDMHKLIKKSFSKYHLFGFTGTPIFAKNSSSGGDVDLKTTEQAFGEKLHTYTILNAINDNNVLKFKVDYVETIKEAKNAENENKKVKDIDRKKALESSKRISNIVKYIHDNFATKTKKNRTYTHNITENITEYLNTKNKEKIKKIQKEIRLSGFNSIFAVSSIEMAKKYYLEFLKQSKNLPINKQLKVATIFSYGANEEENDIGIIDENPEDTEQLDKSSRDFLEQAIKDYNKEFGTSYDTSSDKFQNYYKDISLRVKNREIDVLIVVNMFLTGFDATTLNTLWVDKNLKSHGLVQAFSRTNRILNSIKTFGNIICFRNLEKATDEAISLFGDINAKGTVLLKTYNEYYNGYVDEKNGKEKLIKGYKTLIEELLEKFPSNQEPFGEQNKKDFIKLFSGILRLKNILTSFDEFLGNEILTQRQFQDYIAIYHKLHDEFRKNKESEKEIINDDLVFEMELIKQIEINIDYIISLIKKFHDENCKNKEILSEINRMIDSSSELRNKKDLIKEFIESLKITPSDNVDKSWKEFIKLKKIEELESIIKSENLIGLETHNLINNSFEQGNLMTNGTVFSKILPPINPFTKNNSAQEKRKTVIEKLTNYFERFFRI